MAQQDQTTRWRLAVMAGVLFYVAAAVEFAAGWSARRPLHGGLISVGAMFACVGSLWVVIGAKWKKDGADGAGQ